MPKKITKVQNEEEMEMETDQRHTKYVPRKRWKVIYFNKRKHMWLKVYDVWATTQKQALQKTIHEWFPKQNGDMSDYRGAEIQAFDPSEDRKKGGPRAKLPESRFYRAKKITKARLKKIIRETIEEEIVEAALTSGDALKRKLRDKVRSRGGAQVLVSGNWFSVDDGSMDPEEPDTLFVLDKSGADHEINFTDIEDVK